MKAQDVILGLLLQQGKLSGYTIKHLFESRFSFFFDASYGSVYPTLTKLEKDGFIQKEIVVQEGKPNKNMYTITEKGKEKFQLYLNSEMEKEVLRSDFHMRLYFGEFLSKEEILSLFQKDIEEREKEHQKLSVLYDEFQQYMSETQKISVQMALEFMESSLKIEQKYKEAFKQKNV